MRAAVICWGISLAVATSGCATPIHELFPVRGQSPGRTVYVVSHGWHTGLVLPCDDIPHDIWPEAADFPDARYLEIGWGDEGFYRAEKITAPLCLKPALLPTPSVMHVVGVDDSPWDYFTHSEIVAVELSEAGFIELCRHISESYQRNESGNVVPMGPGIYGESRFYRAEGSYYFPNTCNVWTAKGLRRAGCPITPGIAVAAGNVISQTARFGQVIQRRGERD